MDDEDDAEGGGTMDQYIVFSDCGAVEPNFTKERVFMSRVSSLRAGLEGKRGMREGFSCHSFQLSRLVEMFFMQDSVKGVFEKAVQTS